MNYVFKITSFVFLSLFIVQVQSQSFLDKLPKDISGLSVEEQATILNQIAVFSYQGLLDVPQQGLTAKHPVIEEIISIRHWLEAQKQPLFLLLALQIQQGIDFSIFHEIWRENNTRLGLDVYTPFKAGSFDKPLLTALLSTNQLPAKQLYEYTLNLEGDITEYLKQHNYPWENFLTGAAFEMMPSNMVDTIAGSLITQIILSPFNKLSKSSSGDVLLIKTLQHIDIAENIRVTVRVYLAHGGLPKTHKETKRLIKEELQRTPRMLVSEGNPAFSWSIFEAVERYMERESSYYGSGMTLLFYPFFLEENNKLFPESFQKFAQGELAKGIPFKPGQWLKFAEDQEEQGEPEKQGGQKQ